LRLAAAGYAAGLLARDLSYKIGLVRPLRLGARVISVGNITLGGTGKTPAVIHLARYFHARGERVAVLLRGHGGERLGGVNVVHDGLQRCLGVDEVGDEAVLLADRLGDVPVLAGKDRRLTGAAAVEEFGASVVLLDDGFQYRRLAIDEHIVLLDATQPFGNGRLFPAGTLRDPPSYLARAQQIWITRTDHPGAMAPEALRAKVARVAPEVPVYRTRHLPARLWRFPSGQPVELARLAGRKIMGMAGIGNPSAFWATLQGLQVAELVPEPFPDHHRYQQPEIVEVVRRAEQAGCEAVVTTEKDAVRLDLWPAGGPELWVLGIELVFEGAAPEWPEGVARDDPN
ncbi:MAG: tetraacyldisaccharide 4'-kinase, partial [Armatimonadetes bacterium]|nr:tetraacyldisaccharide 4'-kinase [Armatimonadota bacterium]